MIRGDPRARLEDALRAHLFPELHRLGFAGPDAKLAPDDDVAPYREPQRFFHFHQALPGAGRVVLAVVIKSHARPTFEVFAGHVPPDGVLLFAPEERIPPERVTADMLQDQAHLQAGRGTGYSPFRQPLWSHLVGSVHGIDAAVRRATERLPRLVEWLRSRRPVEHVRTIRHPRPAATGGAPVP